MLLGTEEIVTSDDIPLAPTEEELNLDEDGNVPLGDADLDIDVIDDESQRGDVKIKNNKNRKRKNTVLAILAKTGGLHNVFAAGLMSLFGLGLLYGLVEMLRKKKEQ